MFGSGEAEKSRFPRTRSDKFTAKKNPSAAERLGGGGERAAGKKEKEEDILEELCDVLPATLGPHPRVCVVVERGSHHVLLHFDAVLLALVAVIVRHVEPGRDQKGSEGRGGGASGLYKFKQRVPVCNSPPGLEYVRRPIRRSLFL